MESALWEGQQRKPEYPYRPSHLCPDLRGQLRDGFSIVAGKGEKQSQLLSFILLPLHRTGRRIIMAVAQRDHASPMAPRKFTPDQLVLQIEKWVAEGVTVFAVFGVRREQLQKAAGRPGDNRLPPFKQQRKEERSHFLPANSTARSLTRP